MARVASVSLLHAAPAAGFDRPFEMLSACHERVARTLALLARLEQHLRERGAADAAAREAARDVLRYFDIAAPAHHEDEERHVLPLLRAGGEAAHAELAERLAQDHERMREAWAGLRPALAALAESGSWPADAAAAQFERWSGFAALYDAHARAEDEVAFPFAATRLDATQQVAMGKEMAERRGVKLG
jgi:hemerythrin-like domain-containing protein